MSANNTVKASHANLQQELDAQRRKVDVDHFDISIRELVRMAEEGELRIAPAYQRKFRWTARNESRLIESIFLGLPVPSLFVAANEDGTWELVDGLQRISTLIHFISDKPDLMGTAGQEEPLVLSHLENLTTFNNYPYTELPTPTKLLFSKRPLRVTVLSDKSDYNVRFDLFERLNSGGIALSEQEVRACIYRGEFTELLRELANYDSFLKLLKLQPSKQNDGTREEIVLKFFAYLNHRDKFEGNVRKFLGDYIKEASKSFNLEEGRTLFEKTADTLYEIIKGPILRKNYGNTPINQLEALLVGAAEIINKGELPTTPHKDWLNDGELVRYSTKGTNTPNMLRNRIKRARQLLSREHDPRNVSSNQ